MKHMFSIQVQKIPCYGRRGKH